MPLFSSSSSQLTKVVTMVKPIDRMDIDEVANILVELGPAYSTYKDPIIRNTSDATVALDNLSVSDLQHLGLTRTHAKRARDAIRRRTSKCNSQSFGRNKRTCSCQIVSTKSSYSPQTDFIMPRYDHPDGIKTLIMYWYSKKNHTRKKVQCQKVSIDLANKCKKFDLHTIGDIVQAIKDKRWNKMALSPAMKAGIKKILIECSNRPTPTPVNEITEATIEHFLATHERSERIKWLFVSFIIDALRNIPGDGLQDMTSKIQVKKPGQSKWQAGNKFSHPTIFLPKSTDGKLLQYWSVEEVARWCVNHKRAKALSTVFKDLDGKELTSFERNDIIELMQHEGLGVMIAKSIYREISNLNDQSNITSQYCMELFPTSPLNSSSPQIF